MRGQRVVNVGEDADDVAALLNRPLRQWSHAVFLTRIL
jgi:hypothetical protein